MDSVGSCITPSANMLRLVDLPPPKRKAVKTSGCIDEKGKLQYPPKDFHLGSKKPMKTINQIYRPNVVKLSVGITDFLLIPESIGFIS